MADGVGSSSKGDLGRSIEGLVPSNCFESGECVS